MYRYVQTDVLIGQLEARREKSRVSRLCGEWGKKYSYGEVGVEIDHPQGIYGATALYCTYCNAQMIMLAGSRTCAGARREVLVTRQAGRGDGVRKVVKFIHSY